MATGSILIADDEETFRESTCRLLKREGFDCRCVENAEEAVEALRHDRFDALISDIRMPSNPDLWIVRAARELDSHLPIILVTGFPSMETAIHGINMSVDAYMTKPLDMDELLAHIRKAVGHSDIRRRLSTVVEHLRSVAADLEPGESNAVPFAPITGDALLPTIRALASCLSELLLLRGNPAADRGPNVLCELIDCPQKSTHRQAILEAIAVLKETKDSFKSRRLFDLRTKLEKLLGIK